MIELGLIDLRSESDIVRAHQTARTLASKLGFTTMEQTRIATAVAEIARNAVVYAGGGEVTFGLDDELGSLTTSVRDRGKGIENLPGVLAGEKRPTRGLGLGMVGARKLMDKFAVESTAAGTRVEMAKQLPRRAAQVNGQSVHAMRTLLATQLADDPVQEIRRLQRDVAERDQRVEDLTQELLETNRGVMSLHAELEDRAEYQRQAVELRTRLLSEMGHELRTPLHSITTISQFVLDRLDGDLTTEQEKQLGIIHEVADSLTAYVNDLLDLARADAGRSLVHITRFVPLHVINSVRRIMQPLLHPGVLLRCVVGDKLPTVVSDEPKVGQILRNLVANAIKFTEHGHVEIRAFTLADTLVLEVEDTGVGISDGDHELVFREFAQVDGSVHPRMRGTGLGLPLSRRLANLLGGELSMTSVVGRGSTFRLELPISFNGAAAETVTAEPQPVLVPASVPRGSRPRILVIDDDLASRYVLARWLGDRYEIEEAATGQSGLDRAASRPSLIFLDVIMPDLTGFEVLERLKADPTTIDIPVVVYTALSLGTNDRARLGEATAILRKSTSSRVADRVAIEDALVKAGVALAAEEAAHG